MIRANWHWLLALTVFALWPRERAAALPPSTAISVQGVLRDGSGALETMPVDLTFELWDAEAGGTMLHSEEQRAVPVVGGVFTVFLGGTMGFEPELFADHEALFVAMRVTGEPEFAPRQPLTTVPFAFYAHVAGRARAVGAITEDIADALLAADCPMGQFATGFDATGAIVCAAVSGAEGGDITGVAAGTGLSGGGATGDVSLDVDFGVVQARVTGVCPAGRFVRAIGADGAVTCADDDTGLVYTGVGPISVVGNQIALSGAGCMDGDVLEWNDALSVWECMPEDDTRYTAGSGLVLAGTTFALTNSCSNGQILKWNGSAWACSADDDSAVTYAGASPITVTGTTIGLASTTCTAGEVWKWSGTAWQCVADDDTTYSAGTGLSLAGTTFAVDTAQVQARVTGSCPAGQSIRAIALDGSVVCEADYDSGGDITSVTAGSGLTGGGSSGAVSLAVDTSVVQARVATACLTGNSIRSIAADGNVTCEPDNDTTYSAGTGLTLAGTTFAVNTSVVQARVATACFPGNSIRAIAADGNVTCEADNDTTYSAGTGLALVGTTFSLGTVGCAANEVWTYTGGGWDCVTPGTRGLASDTIKVVQGVTEQTVTSARNLTYATAGCDADSSGGQLPSGTWVRVGGSGECGRLDLHAGDTADPQIPVVLVASQPAGFPDIGGYSVHTSGDLDDWHAVCAPSQTPAAGGVRVIAWAYAFCMRVAP